MSIEIIKETFNIEELKGKSEIQTLVEDSIYLNTIKEAIKDIVWVEGRIEITNTMIIKDKILINGLVKYNTVYKGENQENNIYSLETIKDFNVEMFIKGITEDMAAEINANIEYIEHELEENKLHLRAVINITGQVIETKTLEVIQDVKGREDLEVLRESINYEEVYGRGESYVNIKDTIKIDDNKSSIEKVIKFFVEAYEIESTVAEDRIILSGEALVTIIYLGDGDLYSVKEAIPFNHFLEMSVSDEGALAEVKLDIAEAIYHVVENDLGELKLIDVEIKAKVSGKVYDENSKDLIIDAYSTKENIILEKEEMDIPEKFETIKYSEIVNLDVGINAIDILDIRRDHSIIDKKITDEGILIDGVLNVIIYYIERIGGEITSFSDVYPYKFTIPYESKDKELNIEIKTKLGGVDFSLKRDNVLIENNIIHNIVLSKKRWIYGIKDIKETGELIDKKKMPSITIYIIQKEDRLWDIAKRYNTRSQDILSSNNLDSTYEIKEGDKIIIEKILDLDF